MLEELKTAFKASTQGKWAIKSYRCRADASDIKAGTAGNNSKVGDILWELPLEVGPFSCNHNHWAGAYIADEMADARFIALAHNAMPTLLDALGLLEIAIAEISNEYPKSDERYDLVRRYEKLVEKLK